MLSASTVLPTQSQRRDGFTTVECLVALLLFTVGMLGSVGTVGLATRAFNAGDAAATAGRRLSAVADSLAGAVLAAGGRCTALTAGRAESRHGVTAEWAVSPVAGGRSVQLTVSYRAFRLHADTILGRVPCR